MSKKIILSTTLILFLVLNISCDLIYKELEIKNKIEIALYKLINGNLKTAILLSENIIKGDKNNKFAYYILAQSYKEKGDFYSSINYYKELLKICNKEKNKQWIGIIYNGLGNLYFYNNNLIKAEQYFKRALLSFSILENNFKKATTLLNLSTIHIENNQIDKALTNIEKSYSIFKIYNQKKGIANCLTFKGIIARKRKNYQSAKHFFSDASSIYYEIEDFLHYAYTQRNLALCNFYENKFPDFKKNILNIMKFSKTIGYNKLLSTFYNDLGILYYFQNDYNKSLNSFKKSLDLSLNIQDSKGISIKLTNTADILFQKKNYREAYNLLEEGLQIDIEYGFNYFAFMKLKLLGEIISIKGNLQLSLQNYEKALSLLLDEDIKDELTELSIYYYLALINELLDDNVKTLLYLNKCIELEKKHLPQDYKIDKFHLEALLMENSEDKGPEAY